MLLLILLISLAIIITIMEIIVLLSKDRVKEALLCTGVFVIVSSILIALV